MTITINVKETAYGFVEIEVPDNLTEEEIGKIVDEKAPELYGEGKVNWGKLDFDVTSWEENAYEPQK